MNHLPREAALLHRMSEAFTKPTGQRFLFLAVAAIITMGRRTVSHILWSACCLCQGHPSSYHRFFSKARWSLLPRSRLLAAAVLEWVPADKPDFGELSQAVLAVNVRLPLCRRDVDLRCMVSA